MKILILSCNTGEDKARKDNLVEYGFRLPAARDNRPLRFEEFEQLAGTAIYVSATPADSELMKSEGVIVEQLIRPTGLVDPPLEVRVTLNPVSYTHLAHRHAHAGRPQHRHVVASVAEGHDFGKGRGIQDILPQSI